MTSGATTILPANRERTLLFTLAAIQFTNIVDFMMMMPLGTHLMEYFHISAAQFSWLVAVYGISAATMGFLGGFVLDRFDRRTVLLSLYTGLGLATFLCALAPTYHFLLISRMAAGACGGVAGSVVIAMVGDAIPPQRRGRAMGLVMSAFPLASIFGVPVGLFLAGWLQWHAPFFLLGGLSIAILLLARRILPRVASHRSDAHPVRQMINIVSHKIHVRAFLLTTSLVTCGGVMVAFMAPSLVVNVGLNEKLELPLVYMLGGVCTFFTLPWLGRLSDRHDKLHVLAGVSAVAIAGVLLITRLGPGPLYLTLAVTTLYFVGMPGRFTPGMALITNAVDAKYRGGFMSVNSAVQQASGGLANLVAGLIVTQGPGGRLLHYTTVGWLSCGAFVVTILLAAWLRAAAPHAALNIAPMPPVEPAA